MSLLVIDKTVKTTLHFTHLIGLMIRVCEAFKMMPRTYIYTLLIKKGNNTNNKIGGWLGA